MSLQRWQETYISSSTDGPTLTAAARASCIPTAERKPLPVEWLLGRKLHIRLSGRISCVVTTPGTARFDVCLGSAGTTIVFDTLALNLNVVAKTTVPWVLDVTLCVRAVGAGTSTTLFPEGCYFQSEAVVGSPLPSAGGNGSLLVPVGTPAVGAGFDSTASSILDVFFTQTVATGSLTVHGYQVDVLN
jgi:hypothetical protein